MVQILRVSKTDVFIQCSDSCWVPLLISVGKIEEES